LSPSTSRGVKSATYHHGDLRAALVDAGIELLEAEGLDAVTVRAAARKVGVSHAAPARHFPTATSFLAAIATIGYRRLGAALADAAVGLDAVAGFRNMGRAYVSFAVADPHWYRAIFDASLADKAEHAELQEASADAFDILRNAIAATINAGAVRNDDVEFLALTVWSTVHGLATLIIDDQLKPKGYTDPTEQLIDAVLTALFLGLGNTAS
jgi:AcrR family transcriptional regulator